MTKERTLKDILVGRIAGQAEDQVRHLAGEFVRAASEEKERILAEMEYEKWLAETCWQCLG